MKRKIILASASPRRSEIMMQAGFEFEVRVSDKEEIYKSREPEEIVKELAALKAGDVLERSEEEEVTVIGADTVVVLDGKILGKPKSEEDACSMIRGIQGRKHQVYTGVAILTRSRDGKVNVRNHAVKTEVYVNAMSEEEIKAYVATKESMDKAGAYGIQGRFAVYIEKIEGDYYNVVGLPISYIYQALKEEENADR